jgi:hypothetical protein
MQRTELHNVTRENAVVAPHCFTTKHLRMKCCTLRRPGIAMLLSTSEELTEPDPPPPIKKSIAY